MHHEGVALHGEVRPALTGVRPGPLALSGGGANGAYGAGLLVGWTEQGDRPAFDVVTALPGFADEQKRVIAATVGDLRIVNLYVVNGQDVGTDKYDYKLRWLDAVHGWLAEELKAHPRMVVLGDFNVIPTDKDVYDAKAWKKDALMQPEVRRAYEKLLGQGWTDALRTVFGAAPVYTFWDYFRQHAERDRGLRIDHVLLNPVLGKILVLLAIILFLQWRPAGLFVTRSRSLED